MNYNEFPPHGIEYTTIHIENQEVNNYYAEDLKELDSSMNFLPHDEIPHYLIPADTVKPTKSTKTNEETS